MPDTDLQIRGGGGGRGCLKHFFSALRASVWSKNKGGGGGSPGSATEDDCRAFCSPYYNIDKITLP